MQRNNGLLKVQRDGELSKLAGITKLFQANLNGGILLAFTTEKMKCSNKVTMRLKTFILLAVSVIMFTACAQEASDSMIDLTAEAEAVNETSLSWLENAKAKNAAGIAGLFADDGILFLQNLEPVVGPASIEAHMDEQFEENPDIVPAFGSDRIEVASSGDLAVEFGSWGPSGPEENFGKYITVYRKDDSGWKVIGDMSLSTKPVADTSGN